MLKINLASLPAYENSSTIILFKQDRLVKQEVLALRVPPDHQEIRERDCQLLWRCNNGVQWY